MPVDDQRKGAAPAYVPSARSKTVFAVSTPIASISINCISPIPRRPIADTLGALTDLVRAGKIREIGCSNFSA